MAEEIKQYFTSYRSPGWNAPVETVPQEIETQPEVQPQGWVINSSANVLIDDEGLHIFDGALYMSDISGESVLGPSGFTGSWQLYLSSGGVYNSQFSAGIVGGLVETEVGTGSTVADYDASNSVQLPHWIVSYDPYDALSLVTDTEAPSGRAIQVDLSILPVSGSPQVILYQDVPIIAGRSYFASLHWKRYNAVANSEARIRIYASYRDKDHAIIGTENDPSYGWYTGGHPTTYTPYGIQLRTQNTDSPTPAPANAKYVRLKITLAGQSPLGTAGAIRIGMVELIDMLQKAGGFVLHNYGSWDDQLLPIYMWNDANSLAFRTGYKPDASIIITDTSGGGRIAFRSGEVNSPSVSLNYKAGPAANNNIIAINNGFFQGSTEGWVEPGLWGSWVPYGAGYPTAGYRKDANGYVHLRGLIKNGVVPSTAFQLPVGFRPASSIPTTHIPIVMNSAFGYIGILADGQVEIRTGSNVWADLSGVTFFAES